MFQNLRIFEKGGFTNQQNSSTDLPELFCKQGTTKRVETRKSDRDGRQGRRMGDRSRHVCCRVNYFSLSRTGFVVEPFFLADSSTLRRDEQVNYPLSEQKWSVVRNSAQRGDPFGKIEWGGIERQSIGFAVHLAIQRTTTR